MDFTGEQILPAPRQQVWAAINDPRVLASCLPGCERFEATAEGAYATTVAVRIGALAARFAGTLRLVEATPLHSVTLEGRGQGGIAGFASGRAQVHLAESGDGTLLSWAVEAEVGGRLASLGGRLIHAFAASCAERFFTGLTRHFG